MCTFEQEEPGTCGSPTSPPGRCRVRAGLHGITRRFPPVQQAAPGRGHRRDDPEHRHRAGRHQRSRAVRTGQNVALTKAEYAKLDKVVAGPCSPPSRRREQGIEARVYPGTVEAVAGRVGAPTWALRAEAVRAAAHHGVGRLTLERGVSPPGAPRAGPPGPVGGARSRRCRRARAARPPSGRPPRSTSATSGSATPSYTASRLSSSPANLTSPNSSVRTMPGAISVNRKPGDQLQPERLREHLHPALRRRVATAALVGDPPRGGAHVDQLRVARTQHRLGGHPDLAAQDVAVSTEATSKARPRRRPGRRASRRPRPGPRTEVSSVTSSTTAVPGPLPPRRGPRPGPSLVRRRRRGNRPRRAPGAWVRPCRCWPP